jgi:hypothetical protein
MPVQTALGSAFFCISGQKICPSKHLPLSSPEIRCVSLISSEKHGERQREKENGMRGKNKRGRRLN